MPTRRRFLATSSAIALTAAEYAGAADKPNERVRVAIMGARIRGKFHLSAFGQQANAVVTHLIDPDSNLIPDAMKSAVKHLTVQPAYEADVRKVLALKDVDALVVAAPDHWHALATVWACQAGKHVYCEKPASHNLIEGRRMVEAARKHKRVVQIGTQRRSAKHVIAAREFVAAGKLGKVPFARAWIAGNRPSIGKSKPGEVPKGVDFDLWRGPAPMVPFHANRFHYNWHWFWDMGTGELGNNGIHGLDVARYVLGLDGPTRITSAGGKHFYDDDQQTPDTQVAAFDFPGCTLVWEHRIWSRNDADLEGESFGISLHGEKGTMIFDGKGWHVRGANPPAKAAPKGDPKPAEKPPEVPSEKAVGGFDIAHVKNFLDAIRGDAKLTADVEEGHKSTRLCHLGNIAHRVGRVLTFDPKTETIAGDPAATALLGREYRTGFELPKV